MQIGLLVREIRQKIISVIWWRSFSTILINISRVFHSLPVSVVGHAFSEFFFPRDIICHTLIFISRVNILPWCFENKWQVVFFLFQHSCSFCDIKLRKKSLDSNSLQHCLTYSDSVFYREGFINKHVQKGIERSSPDKHQWNSQS